MVTIRFRPDRFASYRHSSAAWARSVPFLIAGTGVAADEQQTYDEVAAAAAGRRFDAGWDLMQQFISG